MTSVTYRTRLCQSILWVSGFVAAQPGDWRSRLQASRSACADCLESPESNFVSPGTVSNRWLNGHLASLLRVAEKLANDGNTTSSKAAHNHIT